MASIKSKFDQKSNIDEVLDELTDIEQAILSLSHSLSTTDGILSDQAFGRSRLLAHCSSRKIRDPSHPCHWYDYRDY
jgi:hypothetical protein